MKVCIIFGTRPEAIKLAPIILELKKHPKIECHVCVTGQHREMLDHVLEVFEISPDIDLNIMESNQTLASLTARIAQEIDAYLSREKPNLVLVQGDTTTTFVASLVGFYHHIPIGHVEAGLRTGNLRAPWPEEANRVLVSRLASLHFAPTELNRHNLLLEGISANRIFVTGNTVIDALFLALEILRAKPGAIAGLNWATIESWQKSGLVLITGHRRESFGGGLEEICRAIAELARCFPQVQFVYPVHLNPNVRAPVGRILGSGGSEGRRFGNVHLIDPLPYIPFMALMNGSTLILTDSGGIQEEAPSLGKPVLVMRDVTERPEAVEAGTVKLVGTKCDGIVRETANLLRNSQSYATITQKVNPFGDGKATERILRVILESSN